MMGSACHPVPQLVTSTAVCTSQPVAGLPSQSAHPASHSMLHEDAAPW